MISMMTLDFNLKPLYLFFSGCFLVNVAYATLPPRRHESLGRRFNSADLELKSWLDRHSGQISVRNKNKKQILEMEQEGLLERDYALLVSLNERKKYDRDLVERIEKNMSSLGVHEYSVLIPYVFAELMKVPGVTLSQLRKYSEGLDLAGGRSCAKKDLVLSHLRRESALPMHPDRIVKSVAWLSQMQSADRKRYLRDVLKVVPHEKKEQVRLLLKGLLHKDPELVVRYPWLTPKASKELFVYHLSYAKALASRSRCSSARDQLLIGLREKVKSSEGFELATESLHKIARCYRRRGYERSRQTWRDFSGQWENIWGERGKSEIDLRIARLYWQQDRYSQALAHIENILKYSKQPSDHRGNALLLKAKVLENQSKIPEAISVFEDFVASYPQHKEVEQGLNHLLLIYVSRNEFMKAEQAGFRLVALQDEIPRDEREVSSLGFALFWLGRISLQQNKKERAVMYWKRVAREYYSTYYGALGHYLVESVEGKTYQLFPARTGQIRLADLLGVLTEEERQTTLRSATLLRLGLQKEARCEVAELGYDVSRPHLSMIQSLVLHAGGDWLKSIIVYGKIPRSFRQGLPSLTERLLFPRRFNDVVEQYADRLDMDPDFVLSLIRQESVFDPKARSGAGAVGLMQLMRATAKGEAKKLTESYVSQGLKKSLQKPSSKKLMDATANIILGVNHLHGLLKRFENPVYALSAYNAGSTAAKKWMKRFSRDDIFLFIESIPYSETRSYVKLILRNYFYYKRWYGEPGEPLPYLEQLAHSTLKQKPV
ncbi:MAG: transglycosylase SLT domain-containing protein [Oligoflexales bacterium]